jgi:hypothetical protein
MNDFPTPTTTLTRTEFGGLGKLNLRRAMATLTMLVVLCSRAVAAQVSCNLPATLMSDSTAIATEMTWAKAAAAHDTTILKCVLADGFVDTNWRGTLRTRADVLASGPAAPGGLTQHFSDWTVDRHDSSAVVRGLNTITDSANHTVSTMRFTDVLLFSLSRWQAVAAQETMVQK